MVSFSFIVSAQDKTIARSEPTKEFGDDIRFFSDYPKNVTVTIDSTEYDYFAAYLAIQTSEVTNAQLEYTKKLMKYVKQNNGILYIVLQSGTPPCIPGPNHPCPKP